MANQILVCDRSPAFRGLSPLSTVGSELVFDHLDLRKGLRYCTPRPGLIRRPTSRAVSCRGRLESHAPAGWPSVLRQARKATRHKKEIPCPNCLLGSPFLQFSE